MKDFLDFLLFYLILGLNPHIHLFFQLSSCTGWSTIRDFQIFQKTVFLPFLGPLPFGWGVFFDKISSPPLFLTANRLWERCLTAIITLQSPPKNWQSSVTKYWTRASFLTDTVRASAGAESAFLLHLILNYMVFFIFGLYFISFDYTFVIFGPIHINHICNQPILSRFRIIWPYSSAFSILNCV